MVPYISKDLLEHLQTVFPDKLPQSETSPYQLGLLVGQQRVIFHLAAADKRQSAFPSVPQS